MPTLTVSSNNATPKLSPTPPISSPDILINNAHNIAINAKMFKMFEFFFHLFISLICTFYFVTF